METLVWNHEMLVSGIILVVTFVGIFTEGLHGFHRAKFALAGAGAMILAGQYFGYYSPELAIEAIDWNVVFLLGCMMTIVSIMIPTGGFQALAYTIADLSQGRLFLLLVMMGTLVTVLSLLLDNVTTVVIFGPLIILICQALRVSPIPFLLAAALLSDTGGVATLVGDPPNLMIGSAAGIDFNTFFAHMGFIVFCAWVGTVFFLKFLFRKELAVKPEAPAFQDREAIKDPATWKSALGVLGAMVVGFILHDDLGWEAWFVSALGLTALIFLGRNTDLDESFAEVEITLLVFFMALFILIGGVEHSQFLMYIGQFIIPFVQDDLLTATILGMEAQGVNVTPLWWSLAAGVGMGGNSTPLGSTANVFMVTISEKLARDAGHEEYAITPSVWFRKGTPVMLLTLVICCVIMTLFFDFFSTPH